MSRISMISWHGRDKEIKERWFFKDWWNIDSAKIKKAVRFWEREREDMPGARWWRGTHPCRRSSCWRKPWWAYRTPVPSTWSRTTPGSASDSHPAWARRWWSGTPLPLGSSSPTFWIFKIQKTKNHDLGLGEMIRTRCNLRVITTNHWIY